MKIPFVGLKAQYFSIKRKIDFAVESVINQAAFVGSSFVYDFESEFAKALGAKYCIGVGNGTDAIFFALKSLGIGRGDEVVVPANTFIATAEAVSATGAKVVFVDCDPGYYQINPNKIKKSITEKTRAIIAVHLYGQPAPMNEIIKIAKKFHLIVIEDAAQAHLAAYNGNPVGTIGRVGCFSFYPGKNLGAYGDGGAIVTNDKKTALMCRLLTNHGRIDKYNHIMEGYNSRLDGLQAAILSVKLPHVAQWNRKRREIAGIYNSLLRKIPEVITPKEMPKTRSAFHLYVIRCKKRDELKKYLKSCGIETGIHYPTGLPFLKAYSRYKFKPANYPVTFKLQSEILSLPIFPELTKKQIHYVANAVKRFYHV